MTSGALAFTAVVLVSCGREKETSRGQRVSTEAPTTVIESVLESTPGVEVRAARWFRGWAISNQTELLEGALKDYEGLYLEKGVGDVLSVRVFDERDPNIRDDEEYLHAWFQIPPVDETQVPLFVPTAKISAKSCSAWAICREVESRGNLRLLSLSDKAVVAEVTLAAGEWRLLHKATFSPDEPDDTYSAIAGAIRQH